MKRRTRKTRVLLEELEPRILHSADAAVLLPVSPLAQCVEIRIIDPVDAARCAVANTPAAADASAVREVVIVDASVADYEALLEDIRAARGVALDVYVLDSDADGIGQISRILAAETNLAALHIISHGGDGALRLGSAVLDTAALGRQQAEIAGWSQALTQDADILIYGCDVAANDTGRRFVDALARTTGADVAASANLTGAAAAGGDWTLEYRTGGIESTLALETFAQGAWTGTLAISTDAPSASAATVGAENSLTFSHTVANGTDGLLVVQIAVAAAESVTSVTYNGTALTLLAANTESGNKDRVELWYLKAPAAGTANVIVTMGASKEFVAGATTFFGVDQTTPFGATVAAEGVGGTPSVSIVSAAGEVVLDVVALRDRTGGAAAPGQDSLWTNTTGMASSDAWGGSSTQAGAALVTMSWSTMGAGAGEWTAMAVAIKAAVNAAPVLAGANDLASITEDTAANPGTLVSSLLSGQVTDSNVNAAIGIAVTAVDNTSGVWEYTRNGGGTWTAFGSPSTATARLLAADAGTRVRFVPNADWNGNADITFHAWDQSSGTAGGTADVTTNGGTTAFSATSESATVAVTAVNDAPSGTSATLTMLEDATYTFSAADFGFTDASDSPANALLAVKIATLPAAGTLTLTGSGAVSAGQFVSAVDIAAGKLKFAPAADAAGAGYASFDFQVQDDGGTASGGVALDGSARTLTFDVTAVNDAPVRTAGAPAAISVSEDSANATAVTLGLGGLAYGAGGGGDEAAQTFTYRIAAIPAFISLWLSDGTTAVSAGDALSLADLQGLKYKTVADANGAGSLSWTATDSGGTANGGAETLTENLSVTVAAVNDAPVLSGTESVGGINQNATGNSGTLVSDLIAGRLTDADSGALAGIAVTGVNNTNGAWQYSTNGGAAWIAFGTPGATTARLLSADAATFVRFVPNANYVGTVAAGLTFRAWDQTSGIAGATADVSVSGGASAFSAASAAAGITVHAYPILFSGSYTEDFSALGMGGTEMATGYRALYMAGSGATYDAATPVDATAVAGAIVGNQTLLVWNPGDSAFHSNTQLANGGSIADATDRVLASGANSHAGSVIELAMRNTTGDPLATISFAYDMKVLAQGGTSGAPESEASGLPGFSFWYSLTGGTGAAEWIEVPALAATDVVVGSVTSLSATITFATPLASNGTVYFRWVDDNSPSPDQNFAIDNVAVARVNNAPALAAIEGAALAYVENAAATAITSAMTLGDADNANLAGARVAISSGFAVGEDTLGFTNQNGISGSWNAATGVLTLSGSSSLANYQAALRSVTYANGSDAPSTALRTVSFTINDGALDSAAVTRDIAVSAVNDAPTLTGSNDLTGINRNPVSNPGTLVADLLAGRLSDADPDALSGIAVTAVTNTNGAWQYSSDGGATWIAFGSPSGAAARLLAADVDTFVRFVPNANWSGTVAGGLTFRAWDRSAGAALATADTTANGGTTAFSAAAASASIAVGTANTAPTLSGANDLTAINEDAATNGGTRVSTLIAGRVNDVDPGALGGIAVTAVDNTSGDWQYSLNGGTSWSSFGSPSIAGARLLTADANTYVRFAPNAHWNGTVTNGITFRAWDGTSGVAGGTADTSGTTGTYRDDFSSASYGRNDGTLAWSGAWVESDSSGGGAAAGNFAVSGGKLRMHAATIGDSIYREVDLSGASSATLSFTFASSLSKTAALHVQVSGDGGATYTTLAGGVFDASTNTKSGSRSFDITSSIAANTRIRWYVAGAENNAGDNDFDLGTLEIVATGANGAASAFSTATASASIDVAAVNDAPVRTAGSVSNLTVNEDAAVTSLGLGGLAYGPGGGADESAQTLTYTVTAVPAAGLGVITLADGVTAVTASTAYTLAELRGMQFTAATDANGGPATFSWTVSDSGGTGNGGADALGESLTISVTAVNDAPTLTNGAVVVLAATDENTASTPVVVSTLLAGSGAADVDAGASSGIAITGATGRGAWQYSTDGVAWRTFGATGASSALLLASTAQIRYLPDAVDGESATFSFRAWDQTSGAASTFAAPALADPGVGGGASAFSTASASASLAVTAVNDAPTLTNGAVVVLAGTDENTASTPVTVGALLAASGAADVDPGASDGIAVTGATGRGAWEYSTDGVAWRTFGATGASSALLLGSTAQIRYVPDGLNGENVAISFRAWDQTSGAASTFAAPVLADPGVGGGASAFSSASASASLAVTAVNDAPTLTDGAVVVLVATDENTASTPVTVSALLAGSGAADVDAGASGGIAITAATGRGAWQYSTDGVAWKTFGATGASSALLLASTAQIRYLPDGLDGENVTISFRAWDQTSGAASTLAAPVLADPGVGGGTSAFSSASASASLAVSAVNDAPIALDRALRFDGSDVIVVAPSASLTMGATLTIEATLQRTGPLGPGRQIILNKEGEYEIGISAGGKLEVALANTSPGWGWIETAITVPADVGIHIAVTYNSGALRIYANGVLVDSLEGSGPVGDSNVAMNELTFGGRQTGGDQRFVGLLDEVRIWNVERTAADIRSAYRSSLSGAETGLVGYWRFDEASGAVAIDSSGNGNDGSLGRGVAADAPLRTRELDYVVAEDGAQAAAAPGVLAGASDSEGSVLTVRLITAPAHASAFTLNADGSFSYTPTADFNGVDSFVFAASDSALESRPTTVRLVVTRVNDAPSGTDRTVSMLEDTPHVFSAADFGFADGADAAGASGPNALAAVRIATLPLAGTLAYDFAPVAVGQRVSAADLAAGKLMFIPSANAHGVGYAAFTFQVADDGGTDSGGVDLDPVARTLTLDVVSVNDAPAGRDATATTGEGRAYTFAAGDFGFSDAADAPSNALAGVRIAALSGAGSFTLGANTLIAGEIVPASRIAAGELRFTPARGGSGAGYASIVFTVMDDGGTAGGGSDTDSVTRTLTVDVTPAPLIAADVPLLFGSDLVPAAVQPADGGAQPSDGSRSKAALARLRVDSPAAPAPRAAAPASDETITTLELAPAADSRTDSVASIATASSSGARQAAAVAAGDSLLPLPEVNEDDSPSPIVLASSAGGRAPVGAVIADTGEEAAEAPEQTFRMLTVENGVRASAIAVSAGLVTWTLHGAGIVASLLSSAPAWRHVDPLPVLAPEEEKPDWGERDGDASREDDAADRLWLGGSDRRGREV